MLEGVSNSKLVSLEDTQESSYAHTSSSSIAMFPTIAINPHAISRLAHLISRSKEKRESIKSNILVAVLEVDGPSSVMIRKGVDAGKEVSVLKLIVSDGGPILRVTAWRETADKWGGLQSFSEGAYSSGIRRGDVVYLESE